MLMTAIKKFHISDVFHLCKTLCNMVDHLRLENDVVLTLDWTELDACDYSVIIGSER